MKSSVDVILKPVLATTCHLQPLFPDKRGGCKTQVPLYKDESPAKDFYMESYNDRKNTNYLKQFYWHFIVNVQHLQSDYLQVWQNLYIYLHVMICNMRTNQQDPIG